MSTGMILEYNEYSTAQRRELSQVIRKVLNTDVGQGVSLERDNNGWSQQFDKHYAKGRYNKMKSPYIFQTKTPECLAAPVPAECRCQGLELVCDGAKLRAVPSVSPNITMMSLRWNLLRKLSADIFKKYQDLKNLYLQNNKIRAVSERAFRGLYNLTKLYLSHNKITSLKPGVFQDLHKLEWL
ncbi:PREDICTED: relaxin receptor 1-like, partial [Tinamus guttatus]|uniref:relaxin receptor 1-like n=1 Tax=Tinamus guttatus TaxID=94827 RepID=UPI00052F0B8C